MNLVVDLHVYAVVLIGLSPGLVVARGGVVKGVLPGGAWCYYYSSNLLNRKCNALDVFLLHTAANVNCSTPIPYTKFVLN